MALNPPLPGYTERLAALVASGSHLCLTACDRVCLLSAVAAALGARLPDGAELQTVGGACFWVLSDGSVVYDAGAAPPEATLAALESFASAGSVVSGRRRRVGVLCLERLSVRGGPLESARVVIEACGNSRTQIVAATSRVSAVDRTLLSRFSVVNAPLRGCPRTVVPTTATSEMRGLLAEALAKCKDDDQRRSVVIEFARRDYLMARAQRVRGAAARPAAHIHDARRCLVGRRKKLSRAKQTE